MKTEWCNHEGVPLTREMLDDDLDWALAHDRRSATPEQRVAILDMMETGFIANVHIPVFHAIAKILNVCCHCYPCLSARDGRAAN